MHALDEISSAGGVLPAGTLQLDLLLGGDASAGDEDQKNQPHLAALRRNYFR